MDQLMVLSLQCWKGPGGPCVRFLVTILVVFPFTFVRAEDRSVEVERCEVQFLEELETPALHSGPLKILRCKVNDEVRRGDAIAELEDTLVQIRRQAAKLERDAAAAQLADDVELQFAIMAQREAEAEFQSNRAISEKNPGVVTETLLRRLRLANERAGLEIEQTRKARKLAEIALSIRSAELSSIDQQLQRLQVQCPIDGVIRELYRKQGEWVAEGQPIAKIARMDRLRVDALVAASQLTAAQGLGARVSVRWKSTDGERACHGKITSFDPQFYAGGRLRCHAEVENERESGGWKLLPGMEVKMTIYPSSAVSIGRRNLGSGTLK